MPTAVAPESDVLDVDATPSRGLRVLGVLTVLALLVGALAWAEGHRREPDERRALDACVERAVDAVERAETRLALMVNYVGPVLGTTAAEVDAGLRRMVSGQAPAGREVVEAALRTCRDVDVWPLNTEHRAWRAANIEFLQAERQRLVDLERDAADFSSGYDEMSALREEAEALRP